MKIWFNVYTKSLSAATEAFLYATECNTKDLRLASEHHWRTRQFKHYELCFLAERKSKIADYIEEGPFAASPDGL